MASLTNVANMALAMLGQERITRLDTDTSKPASLCNEFLSQVRDECLVLHPWSFAKRRASLPALATAPIFDWDYAYNTPAGCLRVLWLDADDPHEPFAVEDGMVLSNLSAPLGITYITRVTDAGAWSPLFVRLVAGELAAMLTIPLSADKQLVAMLEQRLVRFRAEARSVNAAEGTPRPAYAPAESLILARQ